MKIFTLVNILRYIYRLGFFSGILTLIKFTKSKGIIQVSVNNQPVCLRAGTSDIMVFDQVFVSKEYDYEYGITNAKTIIDCGGNIGLSAIVFAKRYPAAQILVLEPMKETFNLLEQNVKPYSNIKILNGAVWNKDTVLAGSNDFGDEHWSYSVNEPKSGILHSENGIKAYSMDSLLNLLAVATIDILKIDIEGAELELFSNNYENWLPQINCIVIELHDRMRKGTGTAFFRAVSRYDYSYFYYKEKVICLKN